MKTTIGQRILAAVIAHQLGIKSDRALKLYVQESNIDPSWEEVGETLLKNAVASTRGPARSRPAPELESLTPENGNVH